MYRWLMGHNLQWLRPILPRPVRRAWARYDGKHRPEVRKDFLRNTGAGN